MCVTLLAMAVAIAVPGTALAQTGAIAGAVTDETGGVLPGVTINATSPAAIDVRTTVTDGQGLYTLTALVPGVWVVEYSLPGFSTVRREGVELTAGFTANIDTQMSVGGIEETITVTGATPTVDVQNVRTQQVLEQDVLNALPNAQNISAFAALTLGVSITSSSGIGGQDVGGTGGEMGIASIHNNRPTDMKVTQEGMNVNNAMGTNGGNLPRRPALQHGSGRGGHDWAHWHERRDRDRGDEHQLHPQGRRQHLLGVCPGDLHQ